MVVKMLSKIQSRKLKQFLKRMLANKISISGFNFCLDFITNLHVFNFITTNDYITAKNALDKAIENK